MTGVEKDVPHAKVLTGMCEAILLHGIANGSDGRGRKPHSSALAGRGIDLDLQAVIDQRAVGPHGDGDPVVPERDHPGVAQRVPFEDCTQVACQ